ncbi:MAG: hypothetical protein JG777_2677 [Clostridia bacterium]|jgi:hypothetical protein|uniref:hypothetical protein n=1 Tax=Petroclostridium xylanilyticum TaxID=1792311 RepID=UPI000B97E32E|nr:hypothetical protein [Petroclostridium xylanilyticum]MBZ4647188.1 hypothetical protein [Clostridia bacterium]
MLVRKTVIIALVIVMVFGAITYANASSEKDEKIVEKTEKRLEHAYNDIKASFQLDKRIGKFRRVTYTEVIGMGGDVAREMDLLDQQAPIGGTEPVYFISNDFKEIMVLYKEADGTNVMLKSKKVENSWEMSEKKVKGAPILDINAN